ncbi:MAG: nitroreductase, partial [Candidatus Electrothrix sp. AR1]|nr:nitroreductase [Candidatus Electrothrix sp. AR1]
MKYLWKKIRPLFRGCYRLYNIFFGYLYDFNRTFFYGGWKGNLQDYENRNYQLIMLYHGLEKSLSYKQRNPQSGWKNAEKIIHLLKFSYNIEEIGPFDKAAKQVLRKFLSLPENKNTDRAAKIHNELQQIDFDESRNKHGAKEYTLNNFLRGALQHPEDFFLSRFSLREFKNEKVSSQVIMKAIKLALKTPSACNRQPWHIYHTADRKVISSVLKYQQGNKPFGNAVPNLILLQGTAHYELNQ